ncbi:MAG: polysaccharide deacetylase family protein [Treponema sp.]|nr:polysaccharide deacetylase family protein [Treponema sp.]
MAFPFDLPRDTPPGTPPDATPESPADFFIPAVRTIKMNSPAIRKYVQLDGDSGIVVRGAFAEDDGEYEVEYDLKNAVPGGGGYSIPFSVRGLKTGAGQNDRLFWTAGDDEAGLLLSCDDDYRASWEEHYDLLDRYGAKVTFFVQGSVSHAEGRELAAFCREALMRGHDVGFHTVHHLNLTKVSRNVFHWETVSAAEEFTEAGIPLAAFAYPYGFSEPWMHEALLPAFGIVRGYGVKFRLYTAGEIRPGYIVSTAIDNIVYQRDDDFEREIALMLLAAKFIGAGSIVPFTTHDISDDADWGIKPRRLEYLLKTAGDLKLRFYRYRDL